MNFCWCNVEKLLFIHKTIFFFFLDGRVCIDAIRTLHTQAMDEFNVPNNTRREVNELLDECESMLNGVRLIQGENFSVQVGHTNGCWNWPHPLPTVYLSRTLAQIARSAGEQYRALTCKQ